MLAYWVTPLTELIYGKFQVIRQQLLVRFTALKITSGQQSLTVVTFFSDCQKALLNGQQDRQYPDVTTTS